MSDYIEAFKRPFQNAWKLVIGIILAIIPIVNLVAFGYGLRCASTILNKKKDYNLPEWNNFWDLFIKGLSAAVISFIYAIPAMLVIITIFFRAIVTFMTIENLFSDPTELFLYIIAQNAVLGILAIILILFAAIFAPLAILNYVKHGKFSAAFKFGEIVKKIGGKYIFALIIVGVYSAVLSGVLNYIISAPIIVTGITNFVAIYVTGYTLFAEAYKGSA